LPRFVAAILQRRMAIHLKEDAMAQRRKTIGVSNRETFDEDALDGAERPAEAPDSLPERTAGDADMRDRQFPTKTGFRSNAQKEAGTRHTEDAAPSTHKVAGAFGKEERTTDRE
jgi:hypothetical protein